MTQPEPEITAALRAAGGHLIRAARALRVDARWLRQQLLADASLWPEGVQPHAPPVLESSVVTATLRRMLGSLDDAAHALGVSQWEMRFALDAEPSLWPPEIPRGGSPWTRGRRALVPAAALRAALVEHEGGILDVARVLDLAPSVVAARIAAEPELVPAGVTVRRARGGRPWQRPGR